jgi:chromate transporter
VVGAILNLALYFSFHVGWPQGWAGRFDMNAALIGLGAAAALLLFKRHVIHVIAACAWLGLLLTI